MIAWAQGSIPRTLNLALRHLCGPLPEPVLRLGDFSVDLFKFAHDPVAAGL
jgi:hypothetical protein